MIATVENQSNAIQRWFGSGVGQRMLQDEQLLLSRYLPGLFGYHLMKLSVCPSLVNTDTSPIHHCFSLSAEEGCNDAAARCHFHALPLASESVDVTVLHHNLDYSAEPHQLLRETARVLMPYGYVLVFGFQRWSALGIQHTLQHTFDKKNPVTSHGYISVRRLSDWLKFLDFEIVESSHLFFGSVYCILARKTVAGVKYISPARENFLKNPLGALAASPATPVVKPIKAGWMDEKN